MGEGLDAAPVGHLVPPRRIALVWSRHRSLSPLHERFASLARETFSAAWS